MKKIKKAILLVIVLGLMTGCGTAKLSDGKESVVTFKDNAGISAETLYEKLKDKHGVEVLVNLIDTELLSKEYSKTDSEQDYVDNMFKNTLDLTTEEMLGQKTMLNNKLQIKKLTITTKTM